MAFTLKLKNEKKDKSEKKKKKEINIIKKFIIKKLKRKKPVYYIGKWYSTKPLPSALRGPAKHDRSSL